MPRIPVVTVSKFSLLALTAIICLSLQGCDGTGDLDAPKSQSFIIGEWMFDREFTEARMNEEDTKDIGFLGAMLTPMLLDSAEEVLTKITETEIILLNNGQGTARSYTIVEMINDTSVMVKFEDNSVVIFSLIDGRLESPSSGASSVKMYLKPVGGF